MHMKVFTLGISAVKILSSEGDQKDDKTWSICDNII